MPTSSRLPRRTGQCRCLPKRSPCRHGSDLTRLPHDLRPSGRNPDCGNYRLPLLACAPIGKQSQPVATRAFRRTANGQDSKVRPRLIPAVPDGRERTSMKRATRLVTVGVLAAAVLVGVAAVAGASPGVTTCNGELGAGTRRRTGRRGLLQRRPRDHPRRPLHRAGRDVCARQ